MARKEIAVKKYVVRLSAEERERLEAMTFSGKHPAQLLTKARILLKADVSEAGEGWSDSAISAALDTSIDTIGRTRRRLVEEGLEATLGRKYNPNSARPRIFAGAAEAKLMALTCSPAPEGFARWSFALARGEGRRIEHRREGQRQHDRKDFKKRPQTSPQSAMGDPAGRQLSEAPRSRSPPRVSR